MKININKDDAEFLKDFQNELKKQETDCQANPRFWVVVQHKREYHIEDGDGVLACDCDGTEWETIESFKKFLVENDYLEETDFDELDGFQDIVDKLDDDDFRVVSYRDDNYSIAPNTMFLTKRSCKEHIELNHYHYDKPRTYAMTAWRNPEIDRLLKIINELEFTEVEEELNIG